MRNRATHFPAAARSTEKHRKQMREQHATLTHILAQAIQNVPKEIERMKRVAETV